MKINKNKNGVAVISTETIKAWTPAMEQYYPQFSQLSEQKKQLLIGIASERYQALTGMESTGMLSLTGNNATMARNVANPTAGTHNGFTAQKGTSGSADPMFLVGLCIQIAGKTVGLELVQSVPAVSQNVSIDHLVVKYNGGDISNKLNTNVHVLTVTFDKAYKVDKSKLHAFEFEEKSQKYLIIAKPIKPARDVKGGYIFELKSKGSATIDGTSVSDFVEVANENMAVGIVGAKAHTIDTNYSTLTTINVSGDVKVKTAESTSAVENYVPNQTTKGLRRTLGRAEADAGTDRMVELDLKNENYIIGNRVFTGHISRLQYKRMEERGIQGPEYLTAVMKNEISQELNYQIISAARALGVDNALKLNERGTSFNAFYGPASMNDRPFLNIQNAGELTKFDGTAIQSGDFANVPNILKSFQFENVQSIGTNICMLIQQAAYSIGVNSRFGDADAVVVSSSIAGILAASSMYTPAGDRNLYMDAATGAKLSGNIGNIKVYVDVQIPESCPFVTVLRTNQDVQVDVEGLESENLLVPGLAFLVKDIISNTEVVPEGTGGKKIILDSEAELVAIGDNPEDGYLTFAIDIALPGLVNRVS